MPETSCHNRLEDEVVRVLILAKITRGAAGGYADYLQGKAQASALGDYYLKDGERTEAPGRWAAGAAVFGLDRESPVTAEQLHALMDVRRPDTGDQLRPAGGSGEAVAAIDATFSAPKSVSAAWALASPELRKRIEQAHEIAIDRALTYATGQVKMIRRRLDQGTVIHEKATGLVATSWRHTTARAVADQVPDPQLHSHVLLHGAIRRDGRIMAIDSRAWLVHQRELGAAYRTELAHELHHLGFEIKRGTGRGGRYFELDGIPQPLIDRWSSRHHQVHAAIRQRLTDREHDLQAVIADGGPGTAGAAAELELLRATRQLSPAQERMMGTITRAAKLPATTADLDHEWRRTAHTLGINGPINPATGAGPRSALAPVNPDDVLEGLTEFDATFPARDARAIALERSAGTPIPQALESLRDLRASHEILVLADGTGTTRAHRAREHATVTVAQQLSRAQVESLPAAVVRRETERLDHELAQTGGRLSDEQRTAIQLGCSDRQLIVIEGQAGTGKSTTLTGIARAHEALGQQIIVTSTAALAAERLATELTDHGVSCQAYSTAALHAAITSGRIDLAPQTTIIHDEAALASTREQHTLLQAVERSGARLIAVGDPQQNQPVGAGGLWTRIEQTTRGAEAHVELTRNQRARDPADRHDQALFRSGQIEQAIRGYHHRDRVHLHPDSRVAEDHALDAAHADRTSGKSTTVIAQTSNEHLDSLNARAQAIRYQHGQLSEDSLPLPGRPYELHPGDHVQIRHTIQHPDRGPLRNGTTAHVSDIDPAAMALQLTLTDGTTLTLTPAQAARADLRLAYVQHPFPAQGHTTDTTHVIILDHATREGTYVALTRARDHTHIYAAPTPTTDPAPDPLHDITDQASRTEPELASIHTPLAHETTIATETSTQSLQASPHRIRAERGPSHPSSSVTERSPADATLQPPHEPTPGRATIPSNALDRPRPEINTNRDLDREISDQTLNEHQRRRPERDEQQPWLKTLEPEPQQPPTFEP